MSYAHSRFTALVLPAVAAVLIVGGNAFANSDHPTSAAAPAADQSPFLGEWELDLTRMPDSYGPPPKRVVYTFEDVGADQWRTTIDIAAADGSARHVAIRYRRDGQMVLGEGDAADGETAAVNAPAPNVLVMSLANNKILESVRVYAISADGREMTESAADVSAAGAPFVRNFHFRRTR
jgi:hypothetical protein